MIFGSKTWVVTTRMGKALGGVSVPGGKTDDGTAPAEDTGQGVDTHIDRDDTGGDEVLDDEIIHQVAP